MVVTDKRRRC